MTSIPFFKMHGIGNDFVVIPDLDDRLHISVEAVRELCRLSYGIGADAIIRIAPGVRAPFFMDYRNRDGSLAEMCGNGARAVGKWLGDRGHAAESVDLDTPDGVKHLRMTRGGDGLVERVTADMGRPLFPESVSEVLLTSSGEYEFSFVSMGNPHAVMFVDDVDAVALERLGPLFQAHPRFPESVNVELASVQADGRIKERTYERGIGETLACGTGACAVAVAAQRRGLAGAVVEMNLRGGPLTLEWRPGASVLMSGTADEVFTGVLEAERFGIEVR